MQVDPVTFEWIKLGLQLVGALVVARLTVRWALSRYKAEKTWERRFGSYVEAITALSEMRLVVGQWIDAIEEQRALPWETQQQERARYDDAKRKLDEATAAALLLLPESSSDLLKRVELDVANAKGTKDRWTDLNKEYSILEDALTDLITLGRENVGAPPKA